MTSNQQTLDDSNDNFFNFVLDPDIPSFPQNIDAYYTQDAGGKHTPKLIRIDDKRNDTFQYYSNFHDRYTYEIVEQPSSKKKTAFRCCIYNVVSSCSDAEIKDTKTIFRLFE